MNKYWRILFVLLGMLHGCSSANSPGQPNIVWIIAEDLSSQDLGTYGNELVSTPNIDRLARKGVKFNNVFTTAGDCTPSRTALAVGMHQGSIGAHHKRFPDSLKPALPQGIKTMNTHLQENGYVTANIKDDRNGVKKRIGTGKVDWAFKADPEAQFEYQRWDQLAGQENPFFAQISLSHTHRSFPKSDADKHKNINVPPYYPDHPVVRKDFANYFKGIEQVDDGLGKILDSLESHGLKENTIVFFFSDHGRPMTRGKSSLYDSGIKIPAIIHIPPHLEAPPEYQPGSTNDKLISAIDFSATSLSLAGIGKPENMHGRVFWGDRKDADRKYIFGALDRTGGSHFESRAIRSQKYKYIRNYRHDYSINEMATAYTRQHHPIYHLLNILSEQNKLDAIQSFLVEDLPARELYNLEEDPYEINNLAKDPGYQDKIEKLNKRLEEHLKEIDDKGIEPDSQQVRNAFKEYGRQSYQQRKEDIKQLYEQVLQQVH